MVALRECGLDKIESRSLRWQSGGCFDSTVARAAFYNIMTKRYTWTFEPHLGPFFPPRYHTLTSPLDVYILIHST